MITMADGSHKAIKDIEEGDKLLTFSPRFTPKTGNHYVTTVRGVNRGVGYKYRKITLSNGTELKIYGDKQRLYSVEFKKQMCVKYFKVGDHLIDILGNEVEIAAIETIEGENAYHYSLVTDSSLYLANDICVGHCHGIQYLYAKDDEERNKLRPAYEYFLDYNFPTFDELFLAKRKECKTEKEVKKLVKEHQKNMKKFTAMEWKNKKKVVDIDGN